MQSLSYIYHLGKEGLSSFELDRDMTLRHLQDSSVKLDRTLLEHLEENDPREVEDRDREVEGYRLRYVIHSHFPDVVKSFFCPVCQKEYAGASLLRKEIAWNNGSLAGEGVEYLCPKEHTVLYVRLWVS